MALSIFISFLLLVELAVSAAVAATSYPNFQHLNVKESITTTTTTTTTIKNHNLQVDNPLSNTNRRGALKLDVIHRDNLPAAAANSPPLNHTARFSNRIRRDVIRVAALTRRLNTTSKHPSGSAPYSLSDFGSDVVSGMDQGSGEYFVRIGVGSPARPQYVVIDSGSDVVWVQCQPCNLCYRQFDPVFNPAQSSSFAGIPCTSQICSRVDNSDCHSGRCLYEILYNDGSYTKGTLALETLTIGSTRIRDVAIGCGHSNSGMFIGAAGLLGLGGGSLSLVGQLGGQTGGAFSYCLVTRSSESGSEPPSGSLEFGRESLPVGAAWINLLRNPTAPSFYYVGLSGLGVGGVQVPVPESVFALTGAGDGGVVLDTGTAVTRLPEVAYVAFRDSFVEKTGNLPRAEAVSIFDTCYDLSGFVTVRVPTVSFYFKEGTELTLPAKNFLVPVDETATYCFAFATSDTGLSIIGNIQQEGIQISIDGASGFVGFGPNIC